jgi:hypothetical protein
MYFLLCIHTLYLCKSAGNSKCTTAICVHLTVDWRDDEKIACWGVSQVTSGESNVASWWNHQM